MTYKTYNQLMKERYGCKIYKLALSCSSTCPNRDGTKGFGGCVFCSEDGSGTFAQQAQDPVSVQIEKAMALVKSKNPRGYVAYFQKFTSTYRSAEELRPLFREAALHPQIRELAIATRPDCLPPEILCLLEELTRLCPVTVELGLQTSREDTARQINRCYENRVYEKAVEDLHRIGAAVVTHLILGLPGETVEDMVRSAAYAGAMGTDGVKLQMLHILRGTDLAASYEKNPFPLFTPESYAQAVGRCITALPPSVVIHRLTGDGAKKDLIAPLWSLDKKRVMDLVQKHLASLPERT